MVTVTSTVPAARAGEVAVIWVLETTVKLVAAVVPKWTAVAPVKLVPVMVTMVPPAVGPVVGATARDCRRCDEGEVVGRRGRRGAAGCGDGDVDGARVPCAGEVAVIWVSETTVKVEAAVAPKWSAVAAVKPVPVMVTEVPPPVGPAFGTTELTVGTGAI